MFVWFILKYICLFLCYLVPRQVVCFIFRITVLIYSCASAGMTHGYGCQLILSLIHWLLIQKCSSACGNQICFSPMKKVQIFTTLHRKTYSCSFSAMETSSSAWGNPLSDISQFKKKQKKNNVSKSIKRKNFSHGSQMHCIAL